MCQPSTDSISAGLNPRGGPFGVNKSDFDSIEFWNAKAVNCSKYAVKIDDLWYWSTGRHINTSGNSWEFYTENDIQDYAYHPNFKKELNYLADRMLRHLTD